MDGATVWALGRSLMLFDRFYDKVLFKELKKAKLINDGFYFGFILEQLEEIFSFMAHWRNVLEKKMVLPLIFGVSKQFIYRQKEKKNNNK
ncbi:unnamed protein product [Rhizophagus irregularis]|nr:unnamed protein product [Rhizophagus irregularis]